MPVSEALINAAVVTGLAPTKGIALPLISRGGTGWILTAFSLGMVASIAAASDRRRKMLESAGKLVDTVKSDATLGANLDAGSVVGCAATN